MGDRAVLISTTATGAPIVFGDRGATMPSVGKARRYSLKDIALSGCLNGDPERSARSNCCLCRDPHIRGIVLEHGTAA